MTPVAKSNNGNSRLKVILSIGKGVISAVMPRISPIFAMLEPSALPIARLGVSSSTATTEIRISGAEVPKPIIVMPIIIVETPRCLAIEVAPSTNISALHTSKASPTPMEPKASHML